MLTAAGSGYSRWRDLAVTRWREDATRDDWGSYIFLRDVAERRASGRPAISRRGVEPDSYEVAFTEDRAEFIRARRRRSRPTLEVLVSPRGRRRGAPRVARPTSDAARARSSSRPTPSWCWRRPPPTCASGLLEAVRADRVSSPSSARCSRRAGARSPDEPEVWAAHLAVVEGEAIGDPQYRDRSRALPRPRPRDRARRSRCSTAGRCRTRSAPCSIRSSPAPPRARSAGRDGARRLLDAGRAVARRACWTWSTSITTATRSSARRRWPGRRRRCSCAISASTPDEAQPVPAPRRPHPLRRSGAARRRRKRSCAARAAAVGAVAAGHFRRPADRAAAHRRRRGPRHRARSCCAPTSTGA